MFNLKEVGPQVKDGTITFSIYLPNITAPDFAVKVLYIAKEDQFDKSIKAQELVLSNADPGQDPKWGKVGKGLWKSASVTLPEGSYLYRYEILGPAKQSREQLRSLYFGDPFARETASGVFSVFHIGGRNHRHVDNPAFRVPRLADAIIYELNVAEFNQTFDGIVDRLPYLKSLGVNVLELLPVTGVAEPSQWGYTPIFYFAPEERFGGPAGLKSLVDACHQENIAVVLDMVFPHSDTLFPYQVGYNRFFHYWQDHEYDESGQTKFAPNPLVCAFANFGQKNDFRMVSTVEFFKAVCEFWIEEYGIDGFRFDHVNGFLDKSPEFWKGNNEGPDWDNYRPEFKPFQEITTHCYEFSKRFPRFRDESGASRLIQIAEDLSQGSYQLAQISGSAINGCWEEKLYHASTDMATSGCLKSEYAQELLMADGRWKDVLGTKKVGTDSIPVSQVVYNNCHDKSFLMYRIHKKKEWDDSGYEHPVGTENFHWWKLQPYAIGLLTCVGTPMLWQGEELAQSYGIPAGGMGRVRGSRFLHWEYFYTPYEMTGLPTVLPLTTLYRHLCEIRNSTPALRGPREKAVKEFENLESKVLVYRRWLEDEIVLVMINFSDHPTILDIPFGHQGRWVDILSKKYDPMSPYERIVGSGSARVNVDIPSNFGRILRLV